MSDDDLAEVVPQLREHTDHLDVLVNNAGVKWAAGREWAPSAGPIEVLDRAAVVEVVSTNLVGSLMMTKAVLPLLRQPGGVVANISSQLSSFGIGLGVDYAYNCSKAALNMMTVTMDRDISRLGVSVVSVNPGWMRTEMGGAEAPLDVQEATGHIASLLVRLDGTHAGRFVDRFGEPVPW
jgi:NAD(P)-dependent dehydrogenase (short-subunit alcohol dehydrogenase family)